MAKWIEFAPQAQDPRKLTVSWDVNSTSNISVRLGEVKWYGPWRKYCFFANRELALVFDKDCLRDIAQFCEDETNYHKEKR